MIAEALQALTDDVVDELLSRLDFPKGTVMELFPNEYDAILLLGKGLGNDDIAKHMSMTSNAVANLFLRVRHRTGLSRPQMVQYGSLCQLSLRRSVPRSQPEDTGGTTGD